MQIHEIQPRHRPKKARRIGRGGKKGTYSGRGIKGQGARSGARFQPRIRELIKRYPKLRGSGVQARKRRIRTVRVELLEKNFESGETVTPSILVEKNIVKRIKGAVPKVKILGTGKISKALIIQNCEASKSARAKIEKAGGTMK